MRVNASIRVMHCPANDVRVDRVSGEYGRRHENGPSLALRGYWPRVTQRRRHPDRECKLQNSENVPLTAAGLHRID